MATRYYPTKRQNSSRLRGPSAGDWGAFGLFAPQTPDFRQMLSTSKADGGQISLQACACNQQGDYDYIMHRHSTEPLEAQTVSGTFDFCLMGWAYWYPDDTQPVSVRYKFHVYISTGDDPTPRHVLLDNYIDSSDLIDFPFQQWASFNGGAQALVSGDALAGDRIMIEWGVRIISSPTPVVTYPPSAYTQFTIFNLGTTNSSNVPWPDASPGDTNISEAGWFEFSDTITEQAPLDPPDNDSCDDAIEIVAFPYQSPPIITMYSTDTDRGVWWKFTASSTGWVIITTNRTNYRCELFVWTGADCASKVGAGPFTSTSYAAMSNSCAWVEVTEGEQYFINLQNAHSSGIGAINSGGICEIAVNYFAFDLVNDDLYIPVSDKIYVYRDGVIVKVRSISDTATAAYFDYSQLPIDSINGGVDTKIRFCVGLFPFDLVEILDADTLNWDEFEVDYLDGWFVPGSDSTGVTQFFITPEGRVYVSQWGNGYLYVASDVPSLAFPTVYLNETSDDPVLMEVVSQMVNQGANQPGYPFSYDSWRPDPEITSPLYITFDQDSGILYYNSGGEYVPVGGQTIKRFDITNDNQLSDFITLSSGGGPNPGMKGICRLTNGTFLVCNATEVHLLASNGTIIRTFTPSISMDSTTLVDVRPTTDENFFWVADLWANHFFKFRIVDGVEVDDILVSGGPGNMTQFAIYGIVEPPPPFNPLSGIYKVVPGKRNDTLWESFDPEETEDVKIPDPFIKSALFGK